MSQPGAVPTPTSRPSDAAAALAPRAANNRARRTNHPLVPPASLRPRSPQARRWADLVRHWGPRLGAERLADESVRAQLLSLVWLTLQLEQLRDAGPGAAPIHTVLHLTQEVRTLLAALGLSEPTRSNGNGETLEQLLRNGSDGGAP